MGDGEGESERAGGVETAHFTGCKHSQVRSSSRQQ